MTVVCRAGDAPWPAAALAALPPASPGAEAAGCCWPPVAGRLRMWCSSELTDSMATPTEAAPPPAAEEGPPAADTTPAALGPD